MSYVALYRKFRPVVFDEIKGQEQVTKTLKNQVKTDRLQHAYLFTGTRGTGKTSAAKILAKAVNCENPSDGNPCGTCYMCRAISAGTSMNVIEIDAASNNGVDHIREIIEDVQYRPAEGKYKVYIIDEVHMLTPGAFNALLKTLEEPPEYVIFILATTEAGRIPVTILSRCQRYDFSRIDVRAIVERMEELTALEGITAEERALHHIARTADGSMRDALSLLDRCAAFFMGEPLTYERVLAALGQADAEIFYKMTDYLTRGKAGPALRLLGQQIESGMEVSQFVSDYLWFLRNLLIVQTTRGDDAMEMVDVSPEDMREMKEMASDLDPETSMRFIRLLSDLLNRMRFATNRRVMAETGLLLMAKPQGDQSDDALRERLRQIEEQMEAILEGGIVLSGESESEPSEERYAEGEEAEEIPEAAPEDLKKVAANWKELIAQMRPGLLKERLIADSEFQINTDTLENRIYVEVGRKQPHIANALTADEAHREENARELEKYLTRKLGVHISVEIHEAGNRPSGVRDAKTGENIKNKINMFVEVASDEFDDEF